MTVTVRLPGALLDLTDGRAEVPLEGRPGSVREALEEMRERFPAVHARLLTERGAVREHVNLFVGRANVRDAGGLDTALGEDDVILVIPAVSGG